MRLANGDSSWAVGRIPRLQHVSEMPGHAVDADGRQVPEGRRRHRGAPLEKAREGFLRLLELSQVRFRCVGQARGRDVPRMRVHWSRVKVYESARRLQALYQ